MSEFLSMAAITSQCIRVLERRYRRSKRLGYEIRTRPSADSDGLASHRGLREPGRDAVVALAGRAQRERARQGRLALADGVPAAAGALLQLQLRLAGRLAGDVEDLAPDGAAGGLRLYAGERERTFELDRLQRRLGSTKIEGRGRKPVDGDGPAGSVRVRAWVGEREEDRRLDAPPEVDHERRLRHGEGGQLVDDREGLALPEFVAAEQVAQGALLRAALAVVRVARGASH